jgi:DNA-binding NtrC family response regulator
MHHCFGSSLGLEHFAGLFAPEEDAGAEAAGDASADRDMNLKKLKENVEIYAINELINAQGLRFKDAAEKLGLSRQMLHRKIKAYGLRRLRGDAD